MPSTYFDKWQPFDKADWELFAGCESANPLMANCEIGPSANRKAITVVIDGSVVTVLCCGLMYTKACGTPELAKDFANVTLSNSPTFNERRLLLLYGDHVACV